jgi:Tol biopolymer transport system component
MTQVAVDRVGWGRWSPDGQTIVFSKGTGRMNLIVKPSSSTSPDAEQLLVESAQNKAATSWSADGFLLFNSLDPADGMDIWVVPMKEPRVPRVWLRTRFVERGGQFSPDGRFIAYQSNESGRFEIYVRPFDATGPAPIRQWSISSAGGISPRWSPDGKELYYIAPDATLMAVTFTIAGGDVRVSSPKALFATRIRGGEHRRTPTTATTSPATGGF